MVPIVIPLKDLLVVAADIEDRIKGSNTKTGKSNDELLIGWLNGGDDLGQIAGPFPPALPDATLPDPTGPIDIPAILKADEGESPSAIGPLPAAQPPSPSPSLSSGG